MCEDAGGRSTPDSPQFSLSVGFMVVCLLQELTLVGIHLVGGNSCGDTRCLKMSGVAAPQTALSLVCLWRSWFGVSCRR